MKTTATTALALAFALGLASLSLGGCTAATDGSGDDAADTSSDEANLTSAESKTVKELRAALAGLTTGGSEGDPDPFKLVTVTLKRGEKLEPKTLISRALPKLKGMDPLTPESIAEGYVAGYDPTNAPFDVFASDASTAKIKTLEALVRKSLKNVQGGDLGYRSGPNESLETGAVARCIIGQLPSGVVVVIYGIDVWT